MKLGDKKDKNKDNKDNKDEEEEEDGNLIIILIKHQFLYVA